MLAAFRSRPGKTRVEFAHWTQDGVAYSSICSTVRPLTPRLNDEMCPLLDAGSGHEGKLN
jgi:hypothetical protein